MADEQVQVGFGAETAGLEAGLRQISSQLAAFFGDTAKGMEGLKGVSEGLSGVIEKVTGSFGSLVAIVGGGVLFKEAVKAAEEEADATRRLMNGLGMTAEEASKMRVALEMVGMTAEEYTGIAMRFDRQLTRNEAGLNKVGVATRDLNGHLLSQEKLLDNAANRMMEYKAGTDRNAFAMMAFGRNAESAFKLLKINPELRQRAAELAQSIGEIMTQEEIDNVKKYKIEMNAVKIVSDAFMEKLGGAIIPGLTKMATALLQIGVTIMPAVSAAIDVLGEAFSALGNTIKAFVDDAVRLLGYLGQRSSNIIGESIPEDLWTWAGTMMAVKAVFTDVTAIIIELFESLSTAIMWCGNAVVSFYSMVSKGMAFGLRGNPLDEVKKGIAEAEKISREHQERALENHKRHVAAIARDNALAASEKKPRGTENWVDPRTKKDGTDTASEPSEPSYMEQLSGDLIQKKLAYEQYYASIGQLRQMSKEDEAAYWQSAIQYTEKGSKERTAIETRVARLKLDIIKDSLKQQEQLTAMDIERDRGKALAELAIDEENARVRYEMNQSSFDEYEAQLVTFENRRYAIEAGAQQKLIDLDKMNPDNPVKAQQNMDKLLIIQLQHKQKSLQLTNDQTKEATQKWLDLFRTIGDGMQRSLGGFIVGTMNFRSAMQGILSSIQNAFADMIGKIVVNWIAGEAKKLAASVGLNSTLKAMGVAAAEEKVATKAMETAAVVPQDAAQAASGAAASQAGIPIIGPVLAAAAFAATFAMVMGALRSASGGYDIPAGINPVTQLHQREMVLPAHLADNVRNMTGGSGGGQPINLHINAVDGQSVRRFFNQHKTELMKSLREATRNGTHLGLRPTS
ncbi:MAG: hypothetical protein WCH05_05520 [Chlorobiaceae bacterium]